MRLKALVGTGVLALALTLSACGAGDDSGQGSDSSTSEESMTDDQSMTDEGATDDESMSDDESMTDEAMMGGTGTFAGLNDKNVGGTVTVEGNTVTLAGFSSDEGPDLHLYLANGSDEAAVTAGVELGTVAFDEAAQTFTVESGVDVADYTDVVVHCDKAKAVFGAAELG